MLPTVVCSIRLCYTVFAVFGGQYALESDQKFFYR
jgi:hypothetical protein